MLQGVDYLFASLFTAVTTADKHGKSMTTRQATDKLFIYKAHLYLRLENLIMNVK